MRASPVSYSTSLFTESVKPVISLPCLWSLSATTSIQSFLHLLNSSFVTFSSLSTQIHLTKNSCKLVGTHIYICVPTICARIYIYVYVNETIIACLSFTSTSVNCYNCPVGKLLHAKITNHRILIKIHEIYACTHVHAHNNNNTHSSIAGQYIEWKCCFFT